MCNLLAPSSYFLQQLSNWTILSIMYFLNLYFLDDCTLLLRQRTCAWPYAIRHREGECAQSRKSNYLLPPGSTVLSWSFFPQFSWIHDDNDNPRATQLDGLLPVHSESPWRLISLISSHYYNAPHNLGSIRFPIECEGAGYKWWWEFDWRYSSSRGMSWHHDIFCDWFDIIHADDFFHQVFVPNHWMFMRIRIELMYFPFIIFFASQEFVFHIEWNRDQYKLSSMSLWSLLYARTNMSTFYLHPECMFFGNICTIWNYFECYHRPNNFIGTCPNGSKIASNCCWRYCFDIFK